MKFWVRNANKDYWVMAQEIARQNGLSSTHPDVAKIAHYLKKNPECVQGGHLEKAGVWDSLEIVLSESWMASELASGVPSGHRGAIEALEVESSKALLRTQHGSNLVPDLPKEVTEERVSALIRNSKEGHEIERPDTLGTVFPTTSLSTQEYLRGKTITLVTTVLGDGLGDLGLGSSLAQQLCDVGVNLEFVVCCLDSDRAKVLRTIGNVKATIKSGPRDLIVADVNPIAMPKCDLLGDQDLVERMERSHVVMAFPTRLNLEGKRLPEDIRRNFLTVQECVSTGENILGLGLDTGVVGEKSVRRLGVCLSNMGQVETDNVEKIDPVLRRLLLGDSKDIENFRESHVFSVGYVKVPEGKPSLVNPKRLAFLSAGRGLSKLNPTRILQRERTLGFGRLGWPMRGISQCLGLVSPSLEEASDAEINEPPNECNRFLMNFIRLLDVSRTSKQELTLFCPNFEPKEVELESALVQSEGRFKRYKVMVEGATVWLVSGYSNHNDFKRLLNEAALNADIHCRPALIGCAGEGSLAEVLSIQSRSEPVIPIYSPRYDYQETNFGKLAQMGKGPAMEEAIGRALNKICHLHEVDAVEPVWDVIKDTADEIGKAVHGAQDNSNFLNLLAIRLREIFGPT